MNMYRMFDQMDTKQQQQAREEDQKARRRLAIRTHDYVTY